MKNYFTKTTGSYAFECRSVFLIEQRSESYDRYGEVSSADKNTDSAPKTVSCNWLCQLTGRGGV